MNRVLSFCLSGFCYTSVPFLFSVVCHRTVHSVYNMIDAYNPFTKGNVKLVPGLTDSEQERFVYSNSL